MTWCFRLEDAIDAAEDETQALNCAALDLICCLVALTIRSYTVLYLFTVDVISYQVKLLMFYNVQTINLTFVGQIWDIQYIDVVLRNSK